MGQPLLPGFDRVVGLLGNTALGDRTLQAGFVSTYVPRHCGIATFTRDLLDGMRQAATDDGLDGDARPGITAHVAALHVDEADLDYPPEVRVVVDASDPAAYRNAARVLDAHASVVSLQHEFGIFGGDDGRHVLTLVRALDAPLVTTFHTVLPEPTAGQRMVVDELARRSSALVVLSERSRQTMVERYGIPLASVAVMPHGVPDLPFIDPARVKDRFDLTGRSVILGFGLLSPNKRFELVIESLARIVPAVPEATFVIVGATHPEVRRRHGEAYRTMLQERVRQLGLEDHVRFVDAYVDQADLMDWLLASDVFVTPYGSAQQAVSGTLAYALAAGKAIVSTPYEYAQELLADGRGMLTPFDDVGSLGEALGLLLGDRTVRDGMRRRAWEHARAMVWREVGAQHLAVLGAAAAHGAVDDRRSWMAIPVARPRRRRSSAMVAQDLPPVRRHLGRLSDDLGVAQHAVGAKPDLDHGYCTDDVARALVADILHAEWEGDRAVARSIRRHLAFLEEAFEPRHGRFRNFRAADGRWLEEIGSEDCHGRAVAALGETALRTSDRSVRGLASEVIASALPACLELRHPRPWAYAILGCDAMIATGSATTDAHRILQELGDRLAL
ncbi:MAG: glycosyltransferase family 4 protein, partial [Candidatus Limnocylindrales bacterium]